MDVDNGFLCFTECVDIEDVERMIECGEELIETLKNAKKAIEYKEAYGLHLESYYCGGLL